MIAAAAYAAQLQELSMGLGQGELGWFEIEHQG